MKKRNLVIGLSVVVVAGLWFLFRPERLFINKTVNEGMPATAAAAGNPSMKPRMVLTSTFTSSPRTTPPTTIRSKKQGFSTSARSRAMRAIRITICPRTPTFRKIAPSRSGARASTSTSAPRRWSNRP